MLKKIPGLFFLLILLTSPLGTSFGSSSFAEDKGEVLKKAYEAMDRGDRKRTDFYAARWLGLCAKESGTDCGDEQLDPLLLKRKPDPKGFIPSVWDPGFLEWFEKGVRIRWGVEAQRVREKARSFEIAQNTYQDRYFVTAIAYPELESWHVLKDGLILRPFLLPMGSHKDRPTLFFGMTLKSASYQFRPMFIDTQKRTLHYFYRPEFFDLDGDGTPEVWVRFNIAWGNGFAQILNIYRIQNDKELVMFRHFIAAPDGYARRLEDGSVELAIGKRIDLKTQRLETWQYKKGSFQMTSKIDIPSVLLSEKWREIYLE